MEALVLYGVGDLRLEQIPVPHLGDSEVRVRIGFCGVCGSDIPRIFVKGTYNFPTVCGHEFAGIIDACGPSVTISLRVILSLCFPCFGVVPVQRCEHGKYVQCHNYDYLGSRSDGAFAEYVVAPTENLIAVPSGVTLEEAAMTEPAAVALHAVRRANTSLAGKTVAIFGAGPIGVMTAQWARIMGANNSVAF